jgi:hypothetical protein
MKKIRLLLLSVCLLALCMVMLVSCGSELKSPSGLVFDIETQTLHWNAVKGAKYYTIQISGQERDVTTKTTSVSLESLEAGDYEIKIRANGDGEVVDDSDWIVYNFTRAAETGLKYQLINNDTEYELVGGGKASGDVVMEDYFRGKPVTSIADKALYNNNKITSFTVGKNVKTIGTKAFNRCAKMTSIVIPEGVQSIGEYAFQSCKALTEIVFPDSVTSISPYMFDWCSALTKVTLGKNVVEIGEYAFSNCESLTTITYNGCNKTGYEACLPDSLKYIATYAFSDCMALASLSIGDGVEVIAPYAFLNNKSLTKLDLGKGLLMIEERAFARCTALTTVVIPDSTQVLGNRLFDSCNALTDVTFGKGLKSVGYEIFYNTALLTQAKESGQNMLVIDGWLICMLNYDLEKLTITATDNIYGIASYAMLGCSSMVQADIKGVKYVGYASFYGTKSLYQVSFDNALTELGDYAFYGCAYLTSVNLGNGISTIGNYAFASCATLETMEIPQSVMTIGTRAFRDTKAYSNVDSGVVVMGDWVVDSKSKVLQTPFGAFPMPFDVVLEAGVRGIANYAFSGAALKACNLPDTIVYIGRGAFYNAQVSALKLPKSLKYISDYAFYGCAQTNFGGPDTYDLTIPEGTEYIGRSAFYNCGYIVNLVVPASVKTIGPYAFYGCALLGATVQYQKPVVNEAGEETVELATIEGKVVLSEGLESIGDRAFQGCTYMAELTIPNSVTTLGVRIFHKCEGLKSVTIGSGITAIPDYMFYKCTSLEKVVVSDQLVSIGNYAFRGCAALKEFDLKQVQTIGRYSFYGCSSLTELVLPDTLTSIGDYAYRGCTGLTSIAIPEGITAIGKHAFYGLKNTTLYCEADSILPYWSDRFNSSYRPVFWGCTLSDDNSYVVSFTMNAGCLSNSKATNGISNPTRVGYVFVGWATEPGSNTVAYTSENISEAANGTVLYTIWTEQPNDNQEEVQE